MRVSFHFHSIGAVRAHQKDVPESGVAASLVFAFAFRFSFRIVFASSLVKSGFVHIQSSSRF
jgi:hypothetical protein